MVVRTALQQCLSVSTHLTHSHCVTQEKERRAVATRRLKQEIDGNILSVAAAAAAFIVAAEEVDGDLVCVCERESERHVSGYH